MREVLLLSCRAHRRQVDEPLFEESKRPVMQGRTKTKEEATVATDITSLTIHTATLPVVTETTGRRPSHSSTPTPAEKSTSQRLSEWFKKKQNKPLEVAHAQNATHFVQMDTPPPPHPQQSLPRHSPSLLLNEPSPPPMTVISPSYTTSHIDSEIASFTAHTRSRSRSVINPVHSPTPAPVPSLSQPPPQPAAARAPTAPAPQPCTLVLSNLALYIFPPAIAVDLDPSPQSGPGPHAPSIKYFLVYNEYRRISLADILLVSLPYRMGLTQQGTDFALRITDFALHLRDGDTTDWLQAPRNKRSQLVECISDAYENLMGLALEMQQVDYSQLIADILSHQIWSAIREMQIVRWATRKEIMSGYLYHRSLHVWPTAADTGENTPAVADAANANLRMSTPSEWRRKWFVLSQDNYLLHFNSPEEMAAFQFVATASTQHATKFPASFDCNQIDLSKSLYLRGATVCPDGFEIIVYPRTSSMAASSSTVDGAAADVVPNPAVLAFGYTRHLFQIPLPPLPAASSVMLVASKPVHRIVSQVQATLPTAISTTNTTSSAMTPPRATPDQYATALSSRTPALSAFMDGEVNKWLTALRTAMNGPGMASNNDETTTTNMHETNGTAHPNPALEQTQSVKMPPTSHELTVPIDDGLFSAGTPPGLRSPIYVPTTPFDRPSDAAASVATDALPSPPIPSDRPARLSQSAPPLPPRPQKLFVKAVLSPSASVPTTVDEKEDEQATEASAPASPSPDAGSWAPQEPHELAPIDELP